MQNPGFVIEKIEENRDLRRARLAHLGFAMICCYFNSQAVIFEHEGEELQTLHLHEHPAHSARTPRTQCTHTAHPPRTPRTPHTPHAPRAPRPHAACPACPAHPASRGFDEIPDSTCNANVNENPADAVRSASQEKKPGWWYS